MQPPIVIWRLRCPSTRRTASSELPLIGVEDKSVQRVPVKPAEGDGCSTVLAVLELIVPVTAVLVAPPSHSTASMDSFARPRQRQHHGHHHGKCKEKNHKRHPTCVPIRPTSTATKIKPEKRYTTNSFFAFALVKNSALSKTFDSLKPKFIDSNNSFVSNFNYVLLANHTESNHLNSATIYVVGVFCILYFYLLFSLIIVIYYHDL